MKKFLPLILLGAFLAACSSNPAPMAPLELSFKDQPVINLAVDDIKVVQDYKAPMQAPNVDHLLTSNPVKAVDTWVKDRLRATGGPLTARVIIRDASITDTALPMKSGWRGWFVTEESNRYDGKMDVMIEIARPDGYVEAYVSAKSTQSRTVLEKASAAEKERVWFEISQAMANDVGKELEKQINTNFAPILNKPAV